jgi:UDP-galactopyranose mutase
LPLDRFQATGTVNYPDESVPYTRITEFKQLTGQRHDRTTIVREYPSATGDPYYPVPRPASRALYECYRELADGLPEVHFVGRLATYKYYNMDQVIAQALATFRRLADGPGSGRGVTPRPQRRAGATGVRPRRPGSRRAVPDEV